MGLLKHQIARVAPGTARNHLVPSGAAVYAHYLNREKYAKEIEAKAATNAHEAEDIVAVKAQLRKMRILKRLGALKVVMPLHMPHLHPEICNSFLASQAVYCSTTPIQV